MKQANFSKNTPIAYYKRVLRVYAENLNEAKDLKTRKRVGFTKKSNNRLRKSLNDENPSFLFKLKKE
ncbi:MAG: hypothetical protein GX116_00950 [Fibrobacter sp.]|nr:hypothetical protein [Fibrobacter sp.]